MLEAADRAIVIPRSGGGCDESLALRLAGGRACPGARAARMEATQCSPSCAASDCLVWVGGGREGGSAARARRAAARRARGGGPARRDPQLQQRRYHRARRARRGRGLRQVLPRASRSHRQLRRRLDRRHAPTWWPPPSSRRADTILVSHPLTPVQKIVDAVSRHPRQGQRLPHDLRDRRAAGGQGVRCGRLGSAQHHARVDRAAPRPRSAGVRFRLAPLPAPQVRRHDHELHRLPADPRPLRP